MPGRDGDVDSAGVPAATVGGWNTQSIYHIQIGTGTREMNYMHSALIDANLLNTYPMTCYLARTLSLRRFQSLNRFQIVLTVRVVLHVWDDASVNVVLPS
eukprot:gene2958-5434_t